MERIGELLRSPTAWLLLGLVLVYIAGRVLLAALLDVKRATAAQLGRATALPIGLAALVAVVLGRPDAAVAVLLATSVGALTLVVGLTASVEPSEPVPVVWRRVWLFLIPTAVLVLLAGFAGQLTLTHAAILALQGGLILLVADVRPGEIDDEPLPALNPEPPAQPPAGWGRRLEAGLSGAVLLVGSWVMFEASAQPGSRVARFSDVLLAVGVWSPVLLLPLIGAAATLAQKGRTTSVVGGAVTLTLINLCVILPTAIVAWYVMPIVHYALAGGPAVASTTRGVEAGALQVTPLHFPMVTWRLDSVILLVLAVALLPVALGRWTIGRREGVALVVLYALYLVGSAMLGTRY